MRLEIFTPEQWQVLSRDAHIVAFDRDRSPSMDRIDYALLAVNDQVPCGYITVREHDATTVYWAWGGSFPGTRNTARVYQCYKMTYDWTMEKYNRIFTLIENSNVPMLKLAMKVGFRIVGTRVDNGSLFVELLAVKHGS